MKEGSYQSVPAAILNAQQEGGELIDALKTYQNDSSVRIRGKAYNIIKRIGTNQNALEVRQKAIRELIFGLDDADNGIRLQTINALTNFSNTDFTSNQQLRIINRLNSNTPHLDKYVRLVGYMPNDAALLQLKDVYNQVFTGWERFNMQLAMARRGDEASAQAIISKMQEASIGDPFVYDIVPALVYSRSKAVFKFLETIIFSDVANCGSADPDSNANILCGYRTMEYMMPALANAPLTTDQYGELETNDYEAALVTFRAWLTANPNYELVDSRY